MHTQRKGIMLDTGHYMNTTTQLKTAEDAVAYLNKMIDKYEKAHMLHWFKGMHLQLSLGGDYVRKQRKEWREHPMEFDNIPFYELFRLAYDHACHIDLHQPFIGKGVREFVERVAPQYVTLEYQQNSREEYEQFAEAQSKLLKWLTI